MGDLVAQHRVGEAALHFDPEGIPIVCADSRVFPVDLPVAIKVASA